MTPLTVQPTRGTRTFSTTTDNQSTVVIRVYEGESLVSKLNQLVGTFELNGIAPAPAGVPRIDVTIEVDADGASKPSVVV